VEPRGGGRLATGRDEVGWPRGRGPDQAGGRVPGEPEGGEGVHGRCGRKHGDLMPEDEIISGEPREED
jgi:hypothetical protein